MNPELALLSKRARADLLAREARLRKSGQWGAWETLTFSEPVDFGPIGIFRKAHRCVVFSVLDRMDFSGARHLAVSSLSGIRPTWHEMQRMKNELAGEDATAVEVYPPQRELVDGADMFHLWVLPGPLPFSLSRRSHANA